MNKSQLIKKISKKTKISENQTKKTLNATLHIIKSLLKKGENIQIIKFGTFKVNLRSARIGRNPKTGKKINIQPTRVPTFIFGKLFKQAIK